MPLNSALAAVACRLVKRRAASSGSLISASPKSTCPSFSPTSSALPPLMPANASMPLPPMVMSCASSIVEPSDKVTSWLRCSIAKPPSTLRKPNRSTSRFPAALMTSPSEPFRLRLSVPPCASVVTLSVVAPAA